MNTFTLTNVKEDSFTNFISSQFFNISTQQNGEDVVIYLKTLSDSQKDLVVEVFLMPKSLLVGKKMPFKKHSSSPTLGIIFSLGRFCYTKESKTLSFTFNELMLRLSNMTYTLLYSCQNVLSILVSQLGFNVQEEVSDFLKQHAPE